MTLWRQKRETKEGFAEDVSGEASQVGPNLTLGAKDTIVRRRAACAAMVTDGMRGVRKKGD